VEQQPEVWGRELRHKEVTPGYFAAMGLPIVRGRDVSPNDAPDGPPVVLVNEALARTYFRERDPIGQRIAFRRPTAGQPPPVWWTIVGVVRDEKQNGLDEAVAPEVYETHAQNATSNMTLVVRSTTPAGGLVPSIRHALREQDPQVAIFDVRTLRDVMRESVARERFTIWIVGLFAGLALTIAAIGVYGVVSYSVSRRTREIGVRVALGATRSEVAALVLRETLGLVVTGLAAGFLIAALAGRAIAALLFETKPTDPTTYVLVAGALAAVGLLASYVPVRRALAVDPNVALQCE
jgi:predicted permease